MNIRKDGAGCFGELSSSVSEVGDPTPIHRFRKQFLAAYVTFQIGTGKENLW